MLHHIQLTHDNTNGKQLMVFPNQFTFFSKILQKYRDKSINTPIQCRMMTIRQPVANETHTQNTTLRFEVEACKISLMHSSSYEAAHSSDATTFQCSRTVGRWQPWIRYHLALLLIQYAHNGWFFCMCDIMRQYIFRCCFGYMVCSSQL